MMGLVHAVPLACQQVGTVCRWYYERLDIAISSGVVIVGGLRSGTRSPSTLAQKKDTDSADSGNSTANPARNGTSVQGIRVDE